VFIAPDCELRSSTLDAAVLASENGCNALWLMF